MAAERALSDAQASLERARDARARANRELASARIEHERARARLRSREHELAGLGARLTSLEELDARRAGFSEARAHRAGQANGTVGQQGAVADYLEVEPRYERAVEACLGDLLQHVIVPNARACRAGLELVRAAEMPAAAASWSSTPSPTASAAGAARRAH